MLVIFLSVGIDFLTNKLSPRADMSDSHASLSHKMLKALKTGAIQSATAGLSVSIKQANTALINLYGADKKIVASQYAHDFSG